MHLHTVPGRCIFEKRTTAEHRSALYARSEEHTSELQSRFDLVCRLLLEKKNYTHNANYVSTSTPPSKAPSAASRTAFIQLGWPIVEDTLHSRTHRPLPAMMTAMCPTTAS